MAKEKPHFSENHSNGKHGMEMGGYSVTMYRSPNSGDMVFDIIVPEEYEGAIDIFVNDRGVDIL